MKTQECMNIIWNKQIKNYRAVHTTGAWEGREWGRGRARIECNVAKDEGEIFIQQNKHSLPSLYTVYKKKRGGVSHPKTACGTCRASQNSIPTRKHTNTITFIHIIQAQKPTIL